MRKVLIAIDGSMDAHEAALRAKEYGLLAEAEVILFSVASLSAAASPFSEVYRQAAEESMRQELERAQQELGKELSDCCKTIKKLVRTGSPGPEIVRAAKEEQADLIVMGTKGKTGLVSVLIGSVAQYVIAHASTPVFVVPRH